LRLRIYLAKYEYSLYSNFCNSATDDFDDDDEDNYDEYSLLRETFMSENRSLAEIGFAKTHIRAESPGREPPSGIIFKNL